MVSVAGIAVSVLVAWIAPLGSFLCYLDSASFSGSSAAFAVAVVVGGALFCRFWLDVRLGFWTRGADDGESLLNLQLISIEIDTRFLQVSINFHFIIIQK